MFFSHINQLFAAKTLTLPAMRVIIDDKIPFIEGQLEQIGIQTRYLPGKAITREAVASADALIVRTRTLCNEALLSGSRVRFIATATIGYDHLDTAYLDQAGIAWTNCPGCNAASVAQYIGSSLLVMRKTGILPPTGGTLGVIGVGHVGSRVAQVACELGFRVLLNDPPRQASGETGFQTLDTLAQECDVLTFHTPLVRDGQWPTFHMADKAFFASLRHCPLLINSSRGEVVDGRALSDALKQGLIRQAVIDTWENEPDIDRGLLEQVAIGTPHIAGYSADGKANATRMALEALARHFGIDATFRIEPPALPASLIPEADAVRRALQLYDPRRDSEALKNAPDAFEALRGNYPLRREHF